MNITLVMWMVTKSVLLGPSASGETLLSRSVSRTTGSDQRRAQSIDVILVRLGPVDANAANKQILMGILNSWTGCH